MDDLCRMMKKTKLICQDENNDVLIKSYLSTNDHLKNFPTIDSFTIMNHLKRTRDRYCQYNYHIQFTNQLKYIGRYLKEWIEQYDHVIHELSMIPYLLLLSHYIDSELLQSIGELHLDSTPA